LDREEMPWLQQDLSVRDLGADFAFGAFGIDAKIKEGARWIICSDWYGQKGCGQLSDSAT
jgi:hypothetical protein